MPIPDGYDFALAIGATGFETLLAAQLAQGTIPAQVGPLTLATFRCTRAATGPEPLFRIVASGVMFGFTPATLNVVIEFLLGRNDDDERVLKAQRHELEGLRVTDVATGVTSDYPLSNAERADIEQQLDDALASLPLINVDDVIGALAKALDVDTDSATAAVALASALEHEDYQDALMLLASRHPNAPDVDRAPVSLLRRARHVALGFAQDLLNDVVFPAAIDDQFGNLPTTIGDADNHATLRRVSLTVEDDAFLLDAGLQAGGQDINVSGPIYAYYSQPDRGLWLSVRDVKADVEIPSWVLFTMHLLGPFGIIFAFMIPVKLVADALATDVAQERLGRALGDANLLNLGAAGRLGFGDQIALVVRYMEIVHGTLIVGAQFIIGPAQASPVGASGMRRLRWIELDNGEVLGVPDVAELIHSGILAVSEVHTVNYAPGSIHVYLRRNHDATTLNNLRELPSVDIGRLPDYEHPARWLAAFFH